MVQRGLKIGTEMPEDFIIPAAKIRRYSYWIDNMFMINHDHIYTKLYQYCFEKMTKHQRMKLMEYNMQMNKLHEDLAMINPKYAKYLNNNASQEKGNYFAIVKNLTEALAKEWFWNLRTDKKYSKEWIENFLNDLMASGWGETIAKEWKVKSKRLKLECKIIGMLIDAGVLNTSYNAVAQMMGHDELPSDTLANYIGLGKKAKYYMWICDYIRGYGF